MRTFGFRGEALASMSQVARVEILSKTKDATIGHSLEYNDGHPAGAPRPMAANFGTTVTVRDLFYNYPQRTSALRSEREEFNLIVETVALYSIENRGTAFSLNKTGSDPSIKVPPNQSYTDRIRSVLGGRFAENLVPIKGGNDGYGYSVTGMIGSSNSRLKTYTYVFFVNGRLVDCQPLKKALEILYKGVLPKGSCAFVYLSLKIDPKNLDVNIHPTKNEVRFLFEDSIISDITKTVRQLISPESEISISRPTLPASSSILHFVSSPNSLSQSSTGSTSSNPSTSTTRRDSHKVRHDYTEQKIEDVIARQRAVASITPGTMPERKITLKSIVELQEQLTQRKDPRIRVVFRKSSFIACQIFDSTAYAFIQYETSLLQMKLKPVTEELFYQVYLRRFANFPEIKLNPPVNIRDVITKVTKKLSIEEKISRVLTMRVMMDDYFSLKVDEQGNIITLPMLVDGYTPDWTKLGNFIYDLIFKVVWTKEKECFETFGRAISRFYAVDERCLQPRVVSSLLYPVMKKSLLPPQSFKRCMRKLVHTHILYQMFHRC